MSWTTENKNVSSANNFYMLLISFVRLLIYIKNNKGPKMDPCGTPAWISTQDESNNLRKNGTYAILVYDKVVTKRKYRKR